MSEYTEQAEKFLQAHGIKFKAVYLEHGPYFPEDKEERDIWRLSLRRVPGRARAIGGRWCVSFSVRFGQSLVNSDHGNTPPTAYDLLACLTKYDPGTFENFCGDYGYDTDSRRAEKTYKAVRREWAKVSRFFTGPEMEELRDIN